MQIKTLWGTFCIVLLACALACGADETAKKADSAKDAAVEACEAEISGLKAYRTPDGKSAPVCATENYDVIIILGYPSNENCTPSVIQLARVDVAMRFHKAGYASRFITSGGAVYNKCAEADVLKGELVKRGVPEKDVFPEPRAEHTDENIYFSSGIMRENGWKTALIISDPAYHLGYTALCDSNCCVKLGRASLLKFKPDNGKAVQAIRYTLYPLAPETVDDDCKIMADKKMCANLESRRACAGLEWRNKADGE